MVAYALVFGVDRQIWRKALPDCFLIQYRRKACRMRGIDMENERTAGYELEELLPVAAWLTDKYTSKESSSVTYETAAALMEAVCYCIQECFSQNTNGILSAEKGIHARQAYEKGYLNVLEKAGKAKELYEKLIVDFEDYGCLNYRETIIKGLPAFFMKYDARFRPQDHILTLDYPDLVPGEPLSGVDRIYSYLLHITMEKKLLEQFPRQAVCGLLESLQPDYKNLYMDNICYPVLLHALICMIGDCPIWELQAGREEKKLLRIYLEGDSLDKAAEKVRALLGMLVSQMEGMGQEEQDYFAGIGRELAVRMMQAAKSAE